MSNKYDQLQADITNEFSVNRDLTDIQTSVLNHVQDFVDDLFMDVNKLVDDYERW